MTYGNRYVPMTYYDSLADARKTLKENSLLALEAQLEYVEWLHRSQSVEAFRRWSEFYVGIHNTEVRSRADWLHAELTDLMSKASTYYVSEDMCEMVKFAAEDMRRFADEGLSPRDIPMPTGFLFFPKPMEVDVSVVDDLEVPTARSVERHHFTAIAWGVGMVGLTGEGVYEKDGGLQKKGGGDVPSKPGVSYFLFEHAHDAAVFFNQNVQGANKVTESDLRHSFGPMHLYDFSGWAYGMPWVQTEEYDMELRYDDQGRTEVAPGVDQVRRLLLATWRLLREKVTRTESNRPPRHVRRRADRIAPEVGDIVIVKLREERLDRTVAQQPALVEGHDESDESPWYSHRFLVRPHWHRYWVGPRDDPNRQQILKWIEPYVKGPAGAPLIHKDRIYSLEV